MRPTAGAEDQVGYGIDYWRPIRGSHLEHGDVGLLPDFERADLVLQAQRERSANGCHFQRCFRRYDGGIEAIGFAPSGKQKELTRDIDVIAGHRRPGPERHIDAEREQFRIASELQAAGAQTMRHRRTTCDIDVAGFKIDEILRAGPPGMRDDAPWRKQAGGLEPVYLRARMLAARGHGVVARTARRRDDA